MPKKLLRKQAYEEIRRHGNDQVKRQLREAQKTDKGESTLDSREPYRGSKKKK